MAKITLSGVDTRFDGEHELDMDRPFNGRELHLIKQVAGVRLGEIEEALTAGDYDLIVAFTAIALVRAGKIEKQRAMAIVEILLEAEAGNLVFDAGEEDAGPPEPQPAEPKPSESSPPSSATSNGTGDVPLETTPSSIGSLGSVTGSPV